jgi:hypothetical protein
MGCGESGAEGVTTGVDEGEGVDGATTVCVEPESSTSVLSSAEKSNRADKLTLQTEEEVVRKGNTEGKNLT